MKKNSKNQKFSILSLRFLLIVLVLAAVVVAIIIGGPTDSTVTPVRPTTTPIPTSFTLSPVVKENIIPPEHIQTDGVILAAVAVVVVICLGTMMALKNPMPLAEKESNKADKTASKKS